MTIYVTHKAITDHRRSANIMKSDLINIRDDI